MNSISNLSASKFFKYFIYNPKSDLLTKAEKHKVKVARIALMVLTIGTLPAICRCVWSKDKAVKQFVHSRYRKMITDCVNPWKDGEPNHKTIQNSIQIPCNKIFNSLYLGRSKAFVQASYQPCNEEENGKPIPLNTSNPKKFKTLISVCPLTSIVSDFPDLDHADLKNRISQSCSKHKVSWKFLGKALEDGVPGWKGLVHDCTFPDSELAKKEIDVKKGMDQKDFTEAVKEKGKVIDDTPIEEWFEPIFKEMDKAVFKGKRTLVHCQAGQSRSSTLLAAYLINRFHVSSDEAIAFLRSKRLCVKSKFEVQLKEYAEALAKTKKKD